MNVCLRRDKSEEEKKYYKNGRDKCLYELTWARVLNFIAVIGLVMKLIDILFCNHLDCVFAGEREKGNRISKKLREAIKVL